MLGATTLRFVEADEHYSVYEDRYGDEVLIGHGPGRIRVVDFDDIQSELYERWEAFKRDHIRTFGYTYGYAIRSAYMDHLRSLVTDPDRIDDEVTFCADCEDPELAEEMHGTGRSGEHDVCGDCLGSYYTCYDCENQFRHTTTTLSEVEVCERCRDQNWTFCETCDGYRSDEDDGHFHDGSRCCESPAQGFNVRNGETLLRNDERLTISLPAGRISDEGIQEIGYVLRRQADHCFNEGDAEAYRTWLALANRVWAISSTALDGYDSEDDPLGRTWQRKRGTFPKRLSSLAHKEYGVKVTPAMMSEIGNSGRRHSMAVDVSLEVTRDLNQSAAAFVHEDSCWWGGYSESRCVLKSNGGYAIRTWGDYHYPTGRVWVLPLRAVLNPNGLSYLTQTFDAANADAFVVFNGYGDLEDYAPARIVAHMNGMTYRHIGLSIDSTYVNSDSGYLVGSQEIVDATPDLDIDAMQHSNLFHVEQVNNQKVMANA